MLPAKSILFDVSEAAAYLNLKVSRVRMMVFRKELPYLKIGRLVRFNREDIDKWLKENAIRPKVSSPTRPMLKEEQLSFFDKAVRNRSPLRKETL